MEPKEPNDGKLLNPGQARPVARDPGGGGEVWGAMHPPNLPKGSLLASKWAKIGVLQEG